MKLTMQHLAIIGITLLLPCNIGCRPLRKNANHKKTKSSLSYDLKKAPIDKDTHPVVILGGGVSGLNAATRLGMVNYKPLVVQGPIPGGLLTQSHSVRNWPGEIDIDGKSLTDKMYAQAKNAGTIFSSASVTAVDFSCWPYRITLDDGPTPKTISALSVIIAMGTTPNYLNVPGEKTFFGKGVSTCAVCDGDLYRDQTVAIVGGGDAAITEAAYLAKLAKKVYVLVRKDHLRAQDKRKDEVLAKKNVEVLFSTAVKQVHGTDQEVTHLTLENTKTKEQRTLNTNALFLAIGSKPNSALFKGYLDLDAHGYIKIDSTPDHDITHYSPAQKTSLPGVYAIGDIADPHFKQADAAAGDGCKAALQANEFLEHLGFDPDSFEKRKMQTHRSIPEAKPAPAQKPQAVIVEVSSEQKLNELLKQTGMVTIVDLYANWCGPCRGMMPTLKKIATDYAGKVRVLKVNVDTVPSVKRTYSVRGIPRIIFYDATGKKVVDRTGALNYQGFSSELSKIIGS